MDAYAATSLELLRSLNRSDWLPPYDENAVETVFKEQRTHVAEFKALYEAGRREGEDGVEEIEEGIKVRVGRAAIREGQLERGS